MRVVWWSVTWSTLSPWKNGVFLLLEVLGRVVDPGPRCFFFFFLKASPGGSCSHGAASVTEAL